MWINRLHDGTIFDMRSSKLVKNTFYGHFEGFLVIFIRDIEIDVNICEPHYACHGF